MDLSTLIPPEATSWLTRYGLFLGLVLLVTGIVALLFRPFWLWYSGRSEELDRLRRLEETSRKALLELEILNQTLSIPVKKAAQRAQTAEKPPEGPLVVSQETRDGFLKALEKSRGRIMDGDQTQEEKR